MKIYWLFTGHVVIVIPGFLCSELILLFVFEISNVYKKLVRLLINIEVKVDVILWSKIEFELATGDTLLARKGVDNGK